MKKMSFVLLVLFALVSAQQSGFLRSSYAEWMPLAIVIAGISVVASAALIVLSRMFSLKNLEQMAKAEFVFAMSTVAIVMFAGIIVAIGEPFLVNNILSTAYFATFGCFTSVPLPNAHTPMDVVMLYLEPPKKCAQTVLDTLYYVSIYVEAASSWYGEIYMSDLATGFGFKPISERIKNTAANLFFYLYAYYILAYVLKFIAAFGGFFFTVGIALRAFPPTRGAGAYFMAAAVGFYFVFPAVYVIFSALTLPYSWSTTELTSGTYQNPAASASSCTPENIDKHYEQLCIRPDVQGLEEAGVGGDFNSVMEAVQILKAFKDVLTGFLDPSPDSGITSLINRMINAVCIVPIVAMVITMTFVLNSTNLFGGNIPEIGRGLVKLI